MGESIHCFLKGNPRSTVNCELVSTTNRFILTSLLHAFYLIFTLLPYATHHRGEVRMTMADFNADENLTQEDAKKREQDMSKIGKKGGRAKRESKPEMNQYDPWMDMDEDM